MSEKIDLIQQLAEVADDLTSIRDFMKEVRDDNPSYPTTNIIKSITNAQLEVAILTEHIMLPEANSASEFLIEELSEILQKYAQTLIGTDANYSITVQVHPKDTVH